jgi:tRNA pseudouridine55 synthase
MDGVLLVDKPIGPTSFDVVRSVRRLASTKRVGHAGTLDPLASGLLVVCLGTHTRLVPYLVHGEKRYDALVALGEATETDDAEGAVIARAAVPALRREEVVDALSRFTGEISQLPPAYSALKVNGQPAYRMARRGEAVALAPRIVAVHAIDLVELAPDALRLDVRCGAGTYIRSLARDLAVALGTVGHVAALRRTEAAGFTVEEALRCDDLERLASRGELERHVLRGAPCLRRLPRVVLGEEDAAAIGCGKSIEIPPDPPSAKGGSPVGPDQITPFEKGGRGDFSSGGRGDFSSGGRGDFSPRLALLSPAGELLAIGRAEGGRIVPERGFPR